MTDRYLRSLATGTGAGTSWANAYTSLTTALAACVAGDRLFISEDSAGTGSAPVAPGSLTNMVKVICANHAGSVPPVSADLATTAKVTLGTTLNFNIKGCTYTYGVTFQNGATATGNCLLAQVNLDHAIYDNCTHEMVNASASSSTFVLGVAAATKAGLVEMLASNFKFANAGQSISLQGANLKWIGGALQGTGPTTLFTDTGSSTSCSASEANVEGVDLSLVTGTLVGDLPHPVTFRLKNCKLGSGVTIAATQSQPNGAVVYVENSDSGSTNYRHEKHDTYKAIETTETTVVLTGGASDGTTAFSHKIVTTANCDRNTNFEAIPFEIWCDTTGSAKTVTVELMTDGVTLKDNEVWAVLDSLQTAGDPQGTITSSVSDPLAAGSNLATGAGTGAWTTTGLASPVSQKIAFTFTPQKKGLVTVTLFVGRASTTLYASPPTALT